jgi:hypothetical protein
VNQTGPILHLQIRTDNSFSISGTVPSFGTLIGFDGFNTLQA